MLAGMSEPQPDVAALAAMRHPTRMRILAASQDPVTVEEIAGQLGMPVTRLYHHVDRLRSVGLMEVVGEKKSGAAVSSIFQATITNVAATGSFEDVGLILDDARRDAISSHVGDVRAFGRTVATVPRAAAEQLSVMIEEAVQAFRDADKGQGELFTFTYLLAPLAGGQSPLLIRPVTSDDVSHLKRVLHDAVSWDPERVLPPFEIVVNHPELSRYHQGWGRDGDLGVVAELDGEVVGAAFCRLFTEDDHGHGFIDDRTPELAISVWEGHRGSGIGARLLTNLEEAARQAGIDRLSLSVDNENPARRLYLRNGYEPVSSDESGVRMIKEL
jgi:GNAT superfamily N-acetyltransferase/DNA-binding transcriptional ArsR family regulator